MNSNKNLFIIDDTKKLIHTFENHATETNIKLHSISSLVNAYAVINEVNPELIIISLTEGNEKSIEQLTDFLKKIKDLSSCLLVITENLLPFLGELESKTTIMIDYLLSPFEEKEFLRRTNFLLRVIEKQKEDLSKYESIKDSLANSEKRFENLLGSFPNGLVIVVDRNYRIFFIEGEDLKKLGIEKSKAIGRTIDLIFPTKLKNQVMTFLDGAWRGNKTQFEFELNDVTYFCSVAPHDPIKGNVNQLIMILQNISEIRELENRLNDREVRYSTLFEKSADPILLLENTTVIQCNDATVDLLKYSSANEIIGRTILDLSPEYQPDEELSVEKGKRIITKAVEDGSGRFEWVYLTQLGTPIWIDVALTKIIIEQNTYLYTIWRDISELKLTQWKLQKNLSEVEKLNSFLVNRELKMVELKREVNELLHKNGMKPRYKIQ